MLKPTLFSEQEQLQLIELENTGNDFLAYKNLILKAHFAGQDSAQVSKLVNFFDNLVNQTINQINGLKAQASARANAPAPIPKKEESNGQETSK